jgi:hypothetical protein
MSKKITIFFIIFSITVALSACKPFSDNLSKDQIFTLVNQNQELLNNAVSDIYSSGLSDDDIIKSVKKLKGLDEITVKDDIINFDCGGSGFGSSTSYYGFYYTKNENLTAIWCCGGAVVPDGKGWSWKESNGDNSYYTEKISDNFYYYEAHF